MARNLAAFPGCSARPIMYQFPSLDALRRAVYSRADRLHAEYLMINNSLEFDVKQIAEHLTRAWNGAMLAAAQEGIP